MEEDGERAEEGDEVRAAGECEDVVVFGAAEGSHDQAEPEEGEAVETLGGDDSEEIEARRPVKLRRNYKIQEVIKRRQILLIQVVKEERGTKGAALTTFLSLAGKILCLDAEYGSWWWHFSKNWQRCGS